MSLMIWSEGKGLLCVTRIAIWHRVAAPAGFVQHSASGTVCSAVALAMTAGRLLPVCNAKWMAGLQPFPGCQCLVQALTLRDGDSRTLNAQAPCMSACDVQTK